MAGYSGTPLVKKIGIKNGDRLFIVNQPAKFRELLGELPSDTHLLSSPAGELNIAIVFATSSGELKKKFAESARRIAQNGMLWIAWPKKASGIVSDLTENVVREIGLAQGLVDTKVCAIDETWSGLRFVIRLKDRKP